MKLVFDSIFASKAIVNDFQPDSFYASLLKFSNVTLTGDQEFSNFFCTGVCNVQGITQSSGSAEMKTLNVNNLEISNDAVIDDTSFLKTSDIGNLIVFEDSMLNQAAVILLKPAIWKNENDLSCQQLTTLALEVKNLKVSSIDYQNMKTAKLTSTNSTFDEASQMNSINLSISSPLVVEDSTISCSLVLPSSIRASGFPISLEADGFECTRFTTSSLTVNTLECLSYDFTAPTLSCTSLTTSTLTANSLSCPNFRTLSKFPSLTSTSLKTTSLTNSNGIKIKDAKTLNLNDTTYIYQSNLNKINVLAKTEFSGSPTFEKILRIATSTKGVTFKDGTRITTGKFPAVNPLASIQRYKIDSITFNGNIAYNYTYSLDPTKNYKVNLMARYFGNWLSSSSAFRIGFQALNPTQEILIYPDPQFYNCCHLTGIINSGHSNFNLTFIADNMSVVLYDSFLTLQQV